MRRFNAAHCRALLLVLLSSTAAPALAQAAADPPPPTATPPADGARTYTPADFARFAPRNALDMLNNVPGFSIDDSDTERRGLGQATGNVLINGERFSGKSTDIFTELRRISASQRRPDRDRRRRDAQHFRPDAARSPTSSPLAAASPAIIVWRPQIRARRTPLALDQRRGLGQRRDRRHASITLSLRNNSFRNGNAGPGAGDHARRHDPRPRATRC